MELGFALSAARVKKGISIARLAKYLKTSSAAISNLEYGFRRTTAWDLSAYAELCDADIGDIFVKVAGVPSKDRDKNYEIDLCIPHYTISQSFQSKGCIVTKHPPVFRVPCRVKGK